MYFDYHRFVEIYLVYNNNNNWTFTIHVFNALITPVVVVAYFIAIANIIPVNTRR